MSELLEPNTPVQVAAVVLNLEPIETIDIADGKPQAGAAPVAVLDGIEVGVWEMTDGGARDVEVDEVFVVISGSATVEVVDGPTYDVGVGDIVRLSAGDHTTWTVHDTLRKVYVAAVEDEA